MSCEPGTRGNGLLHLKNGVDYINAGEEDQMEIHGLVKYLVILILSWLTIVESSIIHWYRYRRNHLWTAITWTLIVCTAGLLRLIFHWVPRFMLLATHSKCSLEEAETVLLVEKFQGKHTSYYVKKLASVSAEEVSLV